MATNNKQMIRGKAALARAIFNDQRKRRLIPKLQQEGWPIFEIAGKPAAYPAALNAAIARRVGAQRKRPRRKAKATAMRLEQTA